MANLDDLAVDNFREYLRIPSVHPDAPYEECVTFITKQAQTLELPVQVIRPFPRKPVVVVTWIGEEPNLPTIMLNGHMDVVPVYEEEWTYPPFDAVIDKNGDIYARGAQDMKCVSIQYLEAIRRLKNENIRLRRTIHVTFVPDEEVSTSEGMAAFVKSKEFRDLNVGFALDEGMASTDDIFPVINAERSRWVTRVHCPGQPGHGSLLLDNTAGEKVSKYLGKVYKFREQEKKKLDENPSLGPGEVTSVNLTIVEGGVQSNVIPPEFELVFDYRIAVDVDLDKFERTLNEWAKAAGEDVWIEYEQKHALAPPTKLDETNPYWLAFKEAFDQMKLKLKPQTRTCVTDSRYIREQGIPALGFSPMVHTINKAHDHNEYLNKDVFLRGIDIYKKIIVAIADVKGEQQ